MVDCYDKRVISTSTSHVGNPSFESFDTSTQQNKRCEQTEDRIRQNIQSNQNHFEHSQHRNHWHINYKIMVESYLTTLIGDEIRGRGKWSTFVDGEDGFFYGIPSNARRVVKVNPLDKS